MMVKEPPALESQRVAQKTSFPMRDYLIHRDKKKCSETTPAAEEEGGEIKKTMGERRLWEKASLCPTRPENRRG